MAAGDKYEMQVYTTLKSANIPGLVVHAKAAAHSQKPDITITLHDYPCNIELKGVWMHRWVGGHSGKTCTQGCLPQPETHT